MKNELQDSLLKMSKAIMEMVDLVYKGFIQNDAHYLDSALNKERIVDDLEKKITVSLIETSRELKDLERRQLVLLGQIAQNFERMGDELRYLIERIEIKIAEELFFSEIGMKQYQEVFEKMRSSVTLVDKFLGEKAMALLDQIKRNGDEMKQLVEQYRVEHLDRLTRGICQPRAANIFFDMLDFTGNIARHCTNIARIHK
jgi:phosphate:Na+ symporter